MQTIIRVQNAESGSNGGAASWQSGGAESGDLRHVVTPSTYSEYM